MPASIAAYPTALRVAKERLASNADQVNWLGGDATTFAFARHQYDVWHDRAVFHFLTDSKDRVSFVRQIAHALKPGGHVIAAKFGEILSRVVDGDLIRRRFS